MALINRVARLLTADVHAVLDRIEEPHALLRQALREMEEEIERCETRLQRLETEYAASIARREKSTSSIAELDTQLDVSFAAHDEALARRLVRRKLQAEALAATLEERLGSLRDSIGGERARLAEFREQLDVARQQAEVLSAGRDDFAAGTTSGDGTGPIGDDEVEVAFLRERQRRQSS